MEISKRVIDVGITREVIEYLHSKTKLSHYNIKMVNFVRKFQPYTNSDMLITIQLDMFNEKSNSRQMSLDITEKKLKKIKRNLILDKIGI
jgi:hypothetical protein